MHVNNNSPEGQSDTEERGGPNQNQVFGMEIWHVKSILQQGLSRMLESALKKYNGDIAVLQENCRRDTDITSLNK